MGEKQKKNKKQQIEHRYMFNDDPADKQKKRHSSY